MSLPTIAAPAAAPSGLRGAGARVRDGRAGPLPFLRRLFRGSQARIGGVLVALLLVTAIFAPLLAPHDPFQLRTGPAKEPPSLAHPFGTDDIGRDMLSRIMYGARITVQIGAISVALALGLGVTIGLVAGFYGGWVESVLMRFTDIMLRDLAAD